MKSFTNSIYSFLSSFKNLYFTNKPKFIIIIVLLTLVILAAIFVGIWFGVISKSTNNANGSATINTITTTTLPATTLPATTLPATTTTAPVMWNATECNLMKNICPKSFDPVACVANANLHGCNI